MNPFWSMSTNTGRKVRQNGGVEGFYMHSELFFIQLWVIILEESVDMVWFIGSYCMVQFSCLFREILFPELMSTAMPWEDIGACLEEDME